VKIFAWALVGVAVFYGFYALASRLDSIWISFPVFCIALLAMGFVGRKIQDAG
jgi:hypothetical protein